MHSTFTYEILPGEDTLNVSTTNNFVYLNGMTSYEYTITDDYIKKTIYVRDNKDIVAYACLNESKDGKRLYMQPLFCLNIKHPNIEDILNFIIHQLEHLAKDNKLHDISVYLHNDNTKAKKLFSNLKFVETIRFYNTHVLLSKSFK
jgi:hypothetical protein